MVALIKSLQKSDLSVRELMTRTRMSKSAVYNWMEAFRAAGLAHRPQWRICGGRPEAVYAWGPGVDQSPPLPIGNTMRVRRYRQRKSNGAAMLTSILIQQRITG